MVRPLNEKQKLTVKRLLDKSIEAFTVGIELYNKPTINYRVEGFSFFICNAWELMLKAHMMNTMGNDSIYFNKNLNRTISLSDAIKKVFTNRKDPLRLNLDKIIDLRNTSTHFITEDYESIYAPFFQANVVNFVNKMNLFHNIDITEYISDNFINLNLRIEKLSDNNIRAKYSKEMAERIINSRNDLAEEISEEKNTGFAIPVQTNFYITKNPDNADLTLKISEDGDSTARIVKELKDPNSMYPYLTNKVIKLVNRRLNKSKVELFKPNKNRTGVFNQNDFQLFANFYGIKTNKTFTYKSEATNRYTYSIKVVDFIFDEIKKNPSNIISHLKKGIRVNKKR
ncbi:DUF3644 domain-containing protein [Apilactobacillus timberlakei]|uniref:DUF3644 domain-containing protein n=1 Tax=Apilactobacillus timberlakei TaxID=2008380 RepID=UPI00112968A9|nr:DUF3644 domain-containing protein [Apilactobacillus timberlakei]TPR12248.1 DUF3644 domain-containing protein [Apilactobacillus timberlakei]